MDLPRRPEINDLPAASSLSKSILDWWHSNQFWLSWTMLIAPLAVAMIYGTLFQYLFPYLFISPFSILSAYLIYRSARRRLNSKTDEVETLRSLHRATAEAFAT